MAMPLFTRSPFGCFLNLLGNPGDAYSSVSASEPVNAMTVESSVRLVAFVAALGLIVVWDAASLPSALAGPPESGMPALRTLPIH